MPASLRIDPAAAARRIAPYVRRTPLLHVPDERGETCLLKLESLQVTGSFKIRGAANALVALREKATGELRVVACSSGNHGRAVAYMAGRVGVSATICVPDWVDPLKLEEIRRSGAEVLLAGPTYDEADARALELEREGAHMIHPFDAPLVIEGQSTVALEVLEQRPRVGTVLVPLSGGGLAGGMARVLGRAGVEVVAVSAGAANVMAQSLEAGRPLECGEEPTLATALSGGIGLSNRWSFDLIRTSISRHVSVSEPQIADAVRWAYARGLVVEGGGAVAVAAFRSGLVGTDPASTVAVVSGGNIAPRVLAEVLRA